MISFKEYLAESEDQPAEIQTREFEIPVHNMDFLKDKINKLNKTAQKLNCPAIELSISEPFAKEIPMNRAEAEAAAMNHGIAQDGLPIRKKTIQCFKVTIHGAAPKLNGWSFVGKREPMDGSDSVLSKSVPGQELPHEYNDDHDLTCDHCKKKARRSATFVVTNGKKHMEVGRSCLKDFLGHADPDKYASFAESLYDVEKMMSELSDSEYGGGGRATYIEPVLDMVAPAVYLVRNKGFVSRQYEGEGKTATATLVSQHLYPPIPMPRGMSYDDFKIPFTDQDKADAVKIIDWMKSHPKAGKDEFWTNLSKIAKSEHASPRMLGYLCAGVNTYLKEEGTAKAHVGIMSTLKNEGFGKEGDKIDVLGTVISAFAYQNEWGTKHILTVKSDSGHLIKMFTMSGDSGVKKDARIHITGKIGKVEPETYDSSPFKGMTMTTMAPRSRVESLLKPEESDTTYHVGDTVKFRREGAADGVGTITAKPVFGRFEISPSKGKSGVALHVNHEDILCKV